MSQAPSAGYEAQELEAVLQVHSIEIKSLRARLSTAQRECAELNQKLHDSEGELSVVAEATHATAERLGNHHVRDGLVLVAGVERTLAEQAALESELQQTERLLWERDQEIARLRKAARELEAVQFQGELELQSLRQRRGSASPCAPSSASPASPDGSLSDTTAVSASRSNLEREMALLEEARQKLAAKQQEHAALQQQVDRTADEVQRQEAEEALSAERIRALERGLQEKQARAQSQDEQHVREGALLRDHCEELRRALRHEQRDAVAMEQCAYLQPKHRPELEKVAREKSAILASVPGLVKALRVRGLSVLSWEDPGDPIDVQLHAEVRQARAAGLPGPTIMYRLRPSIYLMDERIVRVQLGDAAGASGNMGPAEKRRAPF